MENKIRTSFKSLYFLKRTQGHAVGKEPQHKNNIVVKRPHLAWQCSIFDEHPDARPHSLIVLHLESA